MNHHPFMTYSFTVYGPASGPGMDSSTPEGRERMLKDKRALYERWLDAPCVALDDATPRAAAANPGLRQVLRTELLRMEQTEATLVTPIARMRLDFLWEALALERDAPAEP